MKRRAFVVLISGVIAMGILALALQIAGAGNLNGKDSDESQGIARVEKAQVALYTSDPGNLWNRLHHALHVRVGPDGREYGAERLDPLLWSSTTHLRNGPSYERARAVMEEFLSTRGERQIEDPQKRALLQRGLWAVFDWYVSWPYWHAGGDAVSKAVQPAFAARLAEIIRGVALTPEQIQKLPDNYVAAIAAKEFAAQYDSNQPSKPFLPPDLLYPGSSWIRLGQEWGETVAPQHLSEFGGRSVFLVFIRLPGSLRMTAQYLERVEKLKRPNEELPQFPAGTQVALVRRMLLVDSQGHLRVSPLVESVQIRVYAEVPGKDGRRRNVEETRKQQSVFEFVLDRAKLFRGKAGGLHAIETTESDFMTFQTHGFDPFESKQAGQGEFVKGQFPMLLQCFVCHSGSGVVSIRSRLSLGFDDDHSGLGEAQKTMRWKQQRYEWGLLQGIGYGTHSAPRD
ncbi:MAG: hypothetical protein L0387_00370 [Acidobacteria bacterium]|nr:hypothetical protein [Acidobacteriota bacterium]MCI0718699.1 hypothetical protein [Acidobacteriota bacterium]